MKMIVLTRGVTKNFDDQIWVRTWLIDRLDEAKAFARQSQDANPRYKYQLRYMDDMQAEFLEEKYRDWSSDFDYC